MPLGRQQPLDCHVDLAHPSLQAAWLNRDVITLGAARDAGPGAYDMTPFGAPVEEDVGMTFDGAADWLRRGVADWRIGDSQGMITAWIKLNTVAARQTIFASMDEAASDGWFQFYFDPATQKLGLICRIAGVFTVEVYSQTSLVADQWYHVGIKSTGSAFKFYLNGVEEGVTVATGADNGDWLNQITLRDNITIGVIHRTVIERHFNGHIKDVRYFSTPLPADEVAYMYQQGVPDDDLRLSLDGRGVDLTRYEMPFAKVADVIVGHEQSYGGAADYLKATTPAWRLSDQAGSLAAWVRCADLTKGMAIFASCDEGTDNYIFEWIITNAGVQFVYVFENGVLVGSATGTTVLTQDLWQRVMITSDGSDYLFYVNGVADPLTGGPNENGAWLADVTLRDNVTIGGLEYNSGLILPWEGQISYVKYYSRVLPADEEWDTYRVEEPAY